MTGLLARLLGRLPIGWLQLMKNRTRLIAALGGVTFANILIFMQLGFMNALFETSVFTHRSFGADIVMVSSDFRSLREANPLPRRRMYQALSAATIAEATPVYLGTTLWTDTSTGDTTNFRVLGASPDAKVFANQELQEQTRLLREPSTAIIDRRTREFSPEIEAALLANGRHEIEVSGRRLTLVGMFEQGASFDVDGTLVVSVQTFQSIFPGLSAGAPTLVLLNLEDPDQAASIATRINERIPETDVLAMSKEAFVAAEQNYQATQSPIGFVFGFGVAIGLIVGLVIVYQVLVTDVQDHMSEYATFKAIGYPQSFFLGIVFEEAIILASLGFLPGLLVSLTLYQFAADKTGLPIGMPISRPFFVFVLTATMCTISGAIATKRLNSADPAELF